MSQANPNFGYQFDTQLSRKHYANQLADQSADQSATQPELKPIPNDNFLIIPKIDVYGEVLVGDSINLLNSGIWHRPDTSTPPAGGNTVFVAHRFQYTTGPNTFYHLDKLAVGDEITVFWNGIEYDYSVIEVSVVSPDEVEIEYNTEEPIVTLYTCTPLWTATNRLVVKAKPI